MTIALASSKQLAFISRLLNERAASTFTAALDQDIAGGLTSGRASQWITLLLAQPRRSVQAIAGGDALAEALEKAETSAYAVPTAGLEMIPNFSVRGDLAFFEIRQYMGRKYLRQLHGNVGDFMRTKLDRSTSLAILAVLAGRHVEYAQAFGQHFTVCGRCKSPLTDQRSRETNLGPECRKVWGV